jgi:hypothetical protein
VPTYLGGTPARLHDEVLAAASCFVPARPGNASESDRRPPSGVIPWQCGAAAEDLLRSGRNSIRIQGHADHRVFEVGGRRLHRGVHPHDIIRGDSYPR